MRNDLKLTDGFQNRKFLGLSKLEMLLHQQVKFRESFCESGEGVRLPRERGWPPGKSGKLPGNSGELPGKSGELPGNPWIAVKFQSERTSGEVAEKLPGKFGELPGKSGDFPEARGSLTPPATRQICLQSLVPVSVVLWHPNRWSSKWQALATLVHQHCEVGVLLTLQKHRKN